jgi:hypothetical protein
MKTLISIVFTTGLILSPLAQSGPNGGLADRINEVRTYPNKTVTVDSEKQGAKSREQMRDYNDHHGHDEHDGDDKHDCH